MNVTKRALWYDGKMKGGIRQRGPGSWEIVYDAPLGPDGKRRQVSVALKARNITAAKGERTRLVADRDAGGWIEPARMTTGHFLTTFLNDQAAVRVRAKTLKGYESVVRTRLIPHLGSVPLAKLSAGHIGGLFAAMRDNGRLDGRLGQLTPHYIAGAYRVLRLALNSAVQQGLIRANPIRQVDPVRVPRKEMRALDRSEVQRLLETARGHEIEPLIALLIHTGLRRSEACGLRWGDLDLTLGTLTVARGLHVLKRGEWQFEPPKSQAGRRMVALSPIAALALRRHGEMMEARAAILGVTLSDDLPVFGRPDFTPMLPDTVSHQFSKIAEKAGLGKIGLHTLRHTHATLMLQAGIHPKIVQERLGHSSIQVTLDTYSHVMPGIQAAAALAFDAALRGGPVPERERETVG